MPKELVRDKSVARSPNGEGIGASFSEGGLQSSALKEEEAFTSCAGGWAVPGVGVRRKSTASTRTLVLPQPRGQGRAGLGKLGDTVIDLNVWVSLFCHIGAGSCGGTAT